MTAQTPAPNEPAYLRPSQVARLLGVCGSTVRGLIRAGELDSIRTPGGHYRVPAGAARTLRERMSA